MCLHGNIIAKILDFTFYTPNDDTLSSTDLLASLSYAHADGMPAIRDHPTASTRICGHERAYSTGLAKLKAALRDRLTGKLRTYPSRTPQARRETI